MIHPWTKQFLETKTLKPEKMTEEDIPKPPVHGRETLDKKKKKWVKK